MLKKGLTVAVILLFIGMCVVPATAVQELKEKLSPISFDGNTLYVGGTGPNNYTSIQSAVNDAVDGDTVFVYDDSSPYYENVNVDKSINLIGENKETTVIDGSRIEKAVTLRKNGIKLSGFTIRNGGGDRHWAGVHVYSDFNLITNNIIVESDYGIKLETCSSNTIAGNIISDNDIFGVYWHSSENNTISNNSFMANDGIGIRGNEINLWNSHTIENNTANGKTIRYYKNTKDVVVPSDTAQVILGNCTHCSIQNIDLSDIEAGIQIGLSSHITTSGNTIQDTYYGIALHASSDNEIFGNIITNNSNGIYLRYSWGNHIFNNSIMNGNEVGINFWVARDNRIFWNTFSRNAVGIQFKSHGFSTYENVITGNMFMYHDNVGVSLYSFHDECHDNYIYHNNFVDNHSASDTYQNFWDVRYPYGGNYWSDYTGNDTNGDGIGDIPYLIPGGDNYDYYPLMEFWNYENQKPEKVDVNGVRIGKIGKEYDYAFNATDQNGDALWYEIDWGDGQIDSVGPIRQSEETIKNHAWYEKGIYLVTRIK